MRHALGLGIIPKNPATVDERAAVIQQQRRTGSKTGYQPVPHHPAAGGEVKQAVARAEIGMQLLFF